MASQFLPFWPKAALAGYIANANSEDFYSRALPTNGFTEVVLEMQLDATFGTNVDTTIAVVPQISNDGINWEDQAAVATIAANGTFPSTTIDKYEEIGAFMRMKITLTNTEGAAMTLGATLYVAGTGRS